MITFIVADWAVYLICFFIGVRVILQIVQIRLLRQIADPRLKL